MNKRYDNPIKAARDMGRCVIIHRQCNNLVFRPLIEEDYDIARKEAIEMGVRVDLLGFTENINDANIRIKN